MSDLDTSKIEVDINPDYTMFKKRKNDIYLSDEAVDLLDSYQIDYRLYNSLAELLDDIVFLNDDYDDPDLYNLIDILSDVDYYKNFPK